MTVFRVLRSLGACRLGLVAALGAPLLAAAQAPQLPPPDSVNLDRLGFMSTFPPEPAQRVTLANSYQYPQLRWVVLPMQSLHLT